MAKPVENLTPKARRTRSDLLNAAREVIGHKGVGGVTVMDVCDVAGVGRTSFYNYFDGTDDLVAAVAAEVALDIKTRFDTLHAGEPRGLARLERCLNMLLDFAAEDPKTTLLLTSLAASDRPIRDLLHHEIQSELRGAGLAQDAPAAGFLTTALLALCRDLAQNRVERDAIRAYVSMLMATCAPMRRS
ncbi:TetR/AcrR family transcriptional regulator [Ruegeria sediminis]|uniref:TetR/AcrR family transcriptional regulator n=1 Tax=Ruegeria sediminis TaxID=2583820 RepID=UPI0014860705|nr:TetR/AcrR family transcriptional regulator [Ruegeria sediminis]